MSSLSSDISSLEHSTLKVPYEILNKRFRAAQKTIDREASHVQHIANELEKTLKKDEVRVGDVSGLVKSLIDKLTVLKRKSEEVVSDETEAAALIKRRVDHLKVGADPTANPTALQQWRKVRMDRLLVDYLLRAGYLSTAIKLADRSDIRYLTNLSVFVSAREVAESLGRHEPTKCLEWCYENKSKLRRIRSTLEVKVRRMEFVELVRRGQRLEAVKYARKYFGNLERDQLKSNLDEMSRLMGILAFPINTTVERYRDIVGDESWDRLVKDFHLENFRLYQLNNQSSFSACVQCGLSALKTSQCFVDSLPLKVFDNGDGASKGRLCPICSTEAKDLARPLPFAHVAHSRLICAHTGEPLNENNPPLCLPNGMVYGQNALVAMAAENGGHIVCPRTKQIFTLSDAEKVYVM